MTFAAFHDDQLRQPGFPEPAEAPQVVERKLIARSRVMHATGNEQ